MDRAGEADNDGSRKPVSRRSRRPSRPRAADLFAVVVEMVSSGAAAFKGTARRYSICSADAEDAYQRGLEILMTKAPTASRAELQPWLHTVIKHEALALRGQRERLLGADPTTSAEPPVESVPGPADGIAQRERLRQTAEALGELKSSEIQCLLLKALGYSYDEIAARTGFSWTKVNRSLTEGRKRFFARFGQIESGERCERFAPLLSAASDGEASADDERRLKAHLRSCYACRAALRSYRSAPDRLAQLLPPALLMPMAPKGWWSRAYESLVVATGDRAAALGYKAQHVGELVAAKKTAAVVASTAALAGGAVVHERASDERSIPDAARVGQEGAAAHPPVPGQPPERPAEGPPSEPPSLATGNAADPAQAVSRAEEGAAQEFTPERAAAAAPQPAPREPELSPVAESFESSTGSSAASAATAPARAEEFGP